MELSMAAICFLIGFIWVSVGLFLWWVSLSSSKLNYCEEQELRKPFSAFFICIFWPVLLLWPKSK